jgi:hypothetical protein
MKGQKTGGRVQGSQNHLTKTAREVFKATLEGEVKYIRQAFAKVRVVDPAKYLELFSKYAQYFTPKQLDVANTIKIGKELEDEQYASNTE